MQTGESFSLDDTTVEADTELSNGFPGRFLDFLPGECYTEHAFGKSINISHILT